MYNGSVVPNYFTDEWADFVGLLYDWSSSGVWERDSAQVNDDTRTNNFLAGNHVAYMCYPTSEQLINISRRMSTADSSSSCMIIAPLADEDGTVRGYYSQPRSFEGIIIPAKSTDAQVLVQFIDWMYSDVEHYELAKYGIKGTHWVEGEDVTIGGETYKTWEYPANKAAQYNERPPYSGLLEILINLNVSNRTAATGLQKSRRGTSTLRSKRRRFPTSWKGSICQRSRAHIQRPQRRCRITIRIILSAML